MKGRKTIRKQKDGTDTFDDYGTNSDPKISMTNTTVTVVTNEEVEAVRELYRDAFAHIHEKDFQSDLLPNFCSRGTKEFRKQENGQVTNFPAKVSNPLKFPCDPEEDESLENISDSSNTTAATEGCNKMKKLPVESHGDASYIRAKDFLQRKDLPFLLPRSGISASFEEERMVMNNLRGQSSSARQQQWSRTNLPVVKQEVKRLAQEIISARTNRYRAEIHNEEEPRRKKPSVMKEKNVLTMSTGKYQYKNQPCISYEPDTIDA
ncbi:hypothetical protein TNIN_137871 [Trichonephila inaurata madagascariensis]|uniref:Uncharacterized protein n=1 Tax=Trichonephila inaurata madagascariensis TaxID=2747483 RepID=A0A8X6XYG7_9ARAC|nr:hypothetical protein TNIN_137871 [Trichonephila inaurata madagascariensis]